MNFKEFVKEEIMDLPLGSECCKRAFLYGAIKSCGSLVRGGELKLEISNTSSEVLEFLESIFWGFNLQTERFYGEEDALNKSWQYKLLLSNGVLEFLKDICVLEPFSNGSDIKFNVDKYMIENECCKRAFLRGVFLGCGHASLPKSDEKGFVKSTGYLLDFTFSSRVFAQDFCGLLALYDVYASMIERKSDFFAYLKNSTSILKFFEICNLTRSMQKISEVIFLKEAKNVSNREQNLFLANGDKQISCALNQVSQIEEIDRIIGISSLDEILQETCKKRLEFRELSLKELAEKLKISKSCLNHRLRKIKAIYEEVTS